MAPDQDSMLDEIEELPAKKSNRGGKREGAGRPKKAKAELSCPHGISPVDYLYAVCNGYQYMEGIDGAEGEYILDSSIPRKERIEAAKAVCPYLYPRLSSVDANLDLDGKLHITVVKYSDKADANTDTE